MASYPHLRTPSALCSASYRSCFPIPHSDSYLLYGANRLDGLLGDFHIPLPRCWLWQHVPLLDSTFKLSNALSLNLPRPGLAPSIVSRHTRITKSLSGHSLKFEGAACRATSSTSCLRFDAVRHRCPPLSFVAYPPPYYAGPTSALRGRGSLVPNRTFLC